MKEVLVTIFTPSYNRAHTLPRLYESIKNQTRNDFEWIIVDDGSTDNTFEIVKEFISSNKIRIKYYKQSNGGKHRAINKGVAMAKGELFFIVDSDDWLDPKAISRITEEYDKIKHNDEFCGVCGIKSFENGNRIGGGLDFEYFDTDFLRFRTKYHIKGDMAEVVKTNVMRRFPFPEYDGEKFCPEALVWNRIAMKYKCRYFNGKIYYCEYLPDGLTHNIIRLRYNSPKASMEYYSDYTRLPISYLQKLKGAINFWRFADNKEGKGKLKNRPYFALNLMGWLPGKIMRGVDFFKMRKDKK